MRLPFLVPTLIAFTLPIFAADIKLDVKPTAKPTAKTPILVELFTSEGCSSCPPADALLARLANGQPISNAQIIVLGEHVDYWDALGWRDRFSSPQNTARQNVYGTRFGLDSVYTPQMVVDGTAQFVGNDQRQAQRALTDAARAPKLPLTLSVPTLDGRKFSATVSTAATFNDKADLFAALIDPTDTTEVKRGENGGRTLNHVAVVRILSRIGSTKDFDRGPVAFTLTAPESAIPATMQVVVFAQRDGLGPILGAAISESQVATAGTASLQKFR